MGAKVKLISQANLCMWWFLCWPAVYDIGRVVRDVNYGRL